LDINNIDPQKQLGNISNKEGSADFRKSLSKQDAGKREEYF
jgi:hypothetical protein